MSQVAPPKEEVVAEKVKATTADIFRQGIKPDEVVAGYDDWADSYDEIIKEDMYNAPFIILEEILRQVPSTTRASCRVLDVAAGTGRVGQDLWKEGFRHIDAVEPSEGMMEKLRKCGAYTNEFVEFVGTGQSTVPADTYDLVVICGGMGEGHIPVSGIDDLVRAAKKDGLVIFVMRECFLGIPAYKDKLEPYMDELEEKGVWKKVERRVVPFYYFDHDGLVFVYRKV